MREVTTVTNPNVKRASSAVQANDTGYQYPFSPIVPNRWQGECDCVVGPFSSHTVAEYFASAVADFGHYDAFNKRVFAKGDAYYVEVLDSTLVKPAVIES
jgi:hypothetical protein